MVKAIENGRVAWVGILCWCLTGASVAAAEEGKLGHGLAEGTTLNGVRRAAVQVIRPGKNHAAPAVVVDSQGRVVVALVSFKEGRERIYIRVAPKAGADLGPAFAVSDGQRAGPPALAAGPEGVVWIAWAGRETRTEKGKQQRGLFARRIRPGEPGPVIPIPDFGTWAFAPAMAVDAKGRVHLAWERSGLDHPGRVRIAYRRLTREGDSAGWSETISSGELDLRPAILVAGDQVHVAWDSLVDEKPSGRSDPNYDVFLRTRTPLGWQPEQRVAGRLGIQAAPALAVDPDGHLLVAYHSSHRRGLVKWWTVRRLLRSKKGSVVMQDLASADEAASAVPDGEQQGAEFPSLAVWPDGRLAVVSRPSQGAYLQLVDHAGIGGPLDLTRKGWGARGMRARVALAPDGSLLVARRARHEAVLEHFVLDGRGGSPVWTERQTISELSDTRSFKRPRIGRLAKKGFKVFFGDLHMHSAASDGTGPPDEILARAWARGLDFAALTDHDNIVGQVQLPSTMERIAWLTDLFDARKGFTVLHAYEWTTPPVPKGFGHRNVYFKDRPKSGWCAFRGSCPDSKKLFGALKEGQAIAIPHHTSWTGTDWEAADEAIQRHVEVISVHGASEHLGNQPISSRGAMEGMFAVDGLKRGLKFGFVGGSDAHGLAWHHGLGRRRDPWTHGLTGVIAKKNERHAIFRALHWRSTFATSGARMAVYLRGMGSEYSTIGPVRIEFEVVGDRDLKEVVIVRDGTEVHRVAPMGGKTMTGEWVDEDVAPGDHSYYLRAVQGPEDLPDVAWSSPVFVRLNGKEGQGTRRKTR